MPTDNTCVGLQLCNNKHLGDGGCCALSHKLYAAEKFCAFLKQFCHY